MFRIHTQMLTHPNSHRNLYWFETWKQSLAIQFETSTAINNSYHVDENWNVSKLELSLYQLFAWSVSSRVFLRGKGCKSSTISEILMSLHRAIREILAINFSSRICDKKKQESKRVVDINLSYVFLGTRVPKNAEWVINLEDDAVPLMGYHDSSTLIRDVLLAVEKEKPWLIDISKSFSVDQLGLESFSIGENLILKSGINFLKLPFVSCNTFCAVIFPADNFVSLSKYIEKYSKLFILRLLPCDWVLIHLGLGKALLGNSLICTEGEMFQQSSIYG